MSSIKRQKICFNSYSQNRDIFSERICDDLCEVILQHLSLEDKLRLECVSKQFQRTVLQKQHELKFNDGNKIENTETVLFKSRCFDLKSLESLVKKCPNITSIEFEFEDCREYKCNNYNEFVALITKYCNHLCEFKAPLIQISETAFNEFHKKFGTKLRICKPFSTVAQLNRLKKFPNLEKLESHKPRGRHNGLNPTDVLGLQFNKLKTLKNDLNFDRKVPTHILLMYMKLLDNFKTVRCLEWSSFGRTNVEFINQILKITSNLKELIHLKIDSFIDLNQKEMCDSFKQMANNCQKLKSINCDLTLTEENASNINKLLSPLKAFKQLKRLKVRFNLVNNGTSSEEPMFSFDIFEGFPNITHLSVELIGFNFAENSLTNIDINLPKLRSLKCNGLFNGAPEGVTLTSYILSRLSNLEEIEIKSNNPLFCLRFKEEVIKKCRKIRRIDVKYLNVEQNSQMITIDDSITFEIFD